VSIFGWELYNGIIASKIKLCPKMTFSAVITALYVAMSVGQSILGQFVDK
jgi:hypothetical protein